MSKPRDDDPLGNKPLGNKPVGNGVEPTMQAVSEQPHYTMTRTQPNFITFDIAADLSHLPLIGVAIRSVLSTASLAEAEATLYNIELAAQEIGVNIVKHAYAQDARGRLTVTLQLLDEPRRLLVTFQDTGVHFDPDAIPLPQLGELQEHGFGLFLVRQLMDEVDYEPLATGNRWRLVKQLTMVESKGV